jgi:hypothetical protein
VPSSFSSSFSSFFPSFFPSFLLLLWGVPRAGSNHVPTPCSIRLRPSLQPEALRCLGGQA